MTAEVERAIERIDECLNEVYMPSGVRMRLTHPNRNLGLRRPSELIATGRLSDVSSVLAEAERLSGNGW